MKSTLGDYALSAWLLWYSFWRDGESTHSSVKKLRYCTSLLISSRILSLRQPSAKRTLSTLLGSSLTV